MSEHHIETNKRPSPLGIPLRVSAASLPPQEEDISTPEEDILMPEESIPVPEEDFSMPEERESPRFSLRREISFQARWWLLMFLRWAGLFLLVIFIIEGIFWLWVWHLSPEAFQRFTACLDAGVVPSFWERFTYHIACFGGSL